MEKSLPTLAAICTVVTALSACGTTPQHSNTAKTPAQATAFPVRTGSISPQQATEQSTGFEKQHRHGTHFHEAKVRNGQRNTFYSDAYTDAVNLNSTNFTRDVNRLKRAHE